MVIACLEFPDGDWRCTDELVVEDSEMDVV